MASLLAADLFNVSGLVALVTGGGSGLGMIIAMSLAANGAQRVYITGRRLEKLQAVANEAKGQNIVPIQGDVTSKEDLKRIAQQVKAEIGYLNLLVANAGVMDRSAFDMGPDPSLETFQDFLWTLPERDWERVWTTNVTASMYTVAAFLDLLHSGNEKGNLEQRSQVICISAIAAFIRASPGGGFAYTASKAASTHMFKLLSTVLAPYRIRSNIIAPGTYPSEMASEVIDKITQGGTQPIPATRIPAERIGNEQDMAGAILFLASKAGAFLNGNVILTDGGVTSLRPSTY